MIFITILIKQLNKLKNRCNFVISNMESGLRQSKYVRRRELIKKGVKKREGKSEKKLQIKQ